MVTHHVPVAKTAVFPRLVIDAGEDADVTVVERFTSEDDVLVVPVVQVRAGQAARVRYLDRERAVRPGVADRAPAGRRGRPTRRRCCRR